jgi:3-methylcrotonyl-CoA carboxylase alpha subunit
LKLICRIGGEDPTPVTVERAGTGYRVVIGDRGYDVDLATANDRLQSVTLDDDRQYLVAHHRDGIRHEVSFADRTIHLELVDPLSLKRRRREDEDGGGDSHVRAIMPGRVVKILVAAGDEVKKGQGLLILEAMKMENEIVAPRDGKVASLPVESGKAVENGDDLVVLE